MQQQACPALRSPGHTGGRGWKRGARSLAWGSMRNAALAGECVCVSPTTAPQVTWQDAVRTASQRWDEGVDAC